MVKKRVPADLSGFTVLMELIAEHGGEPRVDAGGDRDRQEPFVAALAAARFTVYPITLERRPIPPTTRPRGCQTGRDRCDDTYQPVYAPTDTLNGRFR